MGAIRWRLTGWLDGCSAARAWWALRHPPKSIHWIPPWRRHKDACSKRLAEEYSRNWSDRTDTKTAMPFLATYSYCPSCDYWDLNRRRPLFWLVLLRQP